MRVWAAWHVNSCGEQHVGLEMDEAQMTARADVDVFVNPGAGLREEGAEFNRGRR